MGCGCKGSKSTDYLITYAGGGTERVTAAEGGLGTVRIKLAKSPQGGTYKAVQPQK